MATETKPTQSHIKFAPLILPRKTPAEELREIVRRISIAPNYETRESLEALAARLETPDEPKRWDGVFPWVAQTVFPRDCRVYFAERLSMFCDMEAEQVVLNETHQNKNQSPYHDGVIITITAGSGDEFPRVMRGEISGRLYLDLGEWNVLIQGVGSGSDIGRIGANEGMAWSPLPPNTVARIVINNTLPTTEQRYSVEVIEPPKPKFEPISLLHGDTVVSVQDATVVNYQHYRRAAMTPLEARQVIAALTAAANHLDPQEQPATEAVAEGLPLEFECSHAKGDKITFSGGRGSLEVKVFHGGKSCWGFLSPADEARLRNLLNQRHADGKGGGA